MDNIIIRQAKADDAEQFVNLHNFIWRYAYGDILPEDVFVKREQKTQQKIEDFKLQKFDTPVPLNLILKN